MNVPTSELRTRFAAALSRMYGTEVPAHTTLVDVATEVDRQRAADDRLGSLERVTAERHGAIRVGNGRELADVADLRARVDRFLDERQLFDPALITRARVIAADGACTATATDAEMAAGGLAYYRGGDAGKPVVYEDFLPTSAAGIFRSNLDGDAAAVDADDRSGYSADWMAGAIGHHVHDPYDLYEKAAS
jgi:uncharacterized glyoxalase superfamily metalloenzyme YdcJ